MNYPKTTYILSQAKKRAYIKRLGCKCKRCQLDLLDKPYCADFHHTNKKKKENNPSDLSTHNFTNSLKELDKCILLCTNCHREEHFNIKRFQEFREQIILKEREVSTESINHFKKEGEIVQRILSLHSEKKHIRTIANELKISRGPVKRILIENGLDPHAWTPHPKISKEQISVLLSQGINNKKEIARRLKCCHQTIHNMFNLYQLRGPEIQKRVWRQQTLLELVRKGITNKSEIARQMNLNYTTVCRLAKRLGIL